MLVACEDATINSTLQDLLSLPNETRIAAVYTLVAHLRASAALPGLIGAITCLLGMWKLSMSRFGRCWGDAVLGVTRAVWLATQTRNNDAMRPPVPSKMGYWQFPHPLDDDLAEKAFQAIYRCERVAG